MRHSEQNLKKLIADHKARIGIIGLGYVGLPLAVEFALKGFKVTGFDVDSKRVNSILKGRSYILDVDSDLLKDLVSSHRLTANHKFEVLSAQDAVIICVPTPLRKSRDPDVSYILSAARQVRGHLKPGQVIILESTTYPGTTQELVLPLLEESGFKAGVDFHLAFSPERVDPGNQTYKIHNTPKVVGGVTPSSTEVAALLYGQIVERVVPVSNTQTAEMVKLLENTFRAVNIGLINEICLMCHRLGLNVWEIIEAASSKPFGFMPFYPGPGLGGHCIPIDPHYLAWKMKALNFEPRFIELAGVINASMPRQVVQRIAGILNTKARALKGSRVLALGMAYKKDVSDYRESPSLDVMQLLIESGVQVSYHDPFVPSIRLGKKVFTSQKLVPRMLRTFDCVVILTAHNGVDYDSVVKSSRLVFDTRQATGGHKAAHLFRL
ncbi:MAG: nucleotide sugar dehydrogenase [Elusimicrobia bacterium]|nr:nucleotide sugar dehydrogenase [Elusimicrobiota bacterium]